MHLAASSSASLAGEHPGHGFENRCKTGMATLPRQRRHVESAPDASPKTAPSRAESGLSGAINRAFMGCPGLPAWGPPPADSSRLAARGAHGRSILHVSMSGKEQNMVKMMLLGYYCIDVNMLKDEG